MRIPQIEPVTTLSKDYRTVFDKLANGPVVLAMRSRAAAVLLSVEEYEDMVSRLERFELIAAAKHNLAKAKADPSTLTSHDELKRLMLEKQAAHVDA